MISKKEIKFNDIRPLAIKIVEIIVFLTDNKELFLDNKHDYPDCDLGFDIITTDWINGKIIITTIPHWMIEKILDDNSLILEFCCEKADYIKSKQIK